MVNKWSAAAAAGTPIKAGAAGHRALAFEGRLFCLNNKAGSNPGLFIIGPGRRHFRRITPTDKTFLGGARLIPESGLRAGRPANFHMRRMLRRHGALADENDPWDQPPEWVRLNDLPEFLCRHLNCKGMETEFTRSVIDAVRLKRINHRVAGIADSRILRGTSRRPTGLASKSFWGVIVRDWDEAKVDWRLGTVAAPASAGDLKRCCIEVKWPEAAGYFGRSWVLNPIKQRFSEEIKTAESARQNASLIDAPREIKNKTGPKRPKRTAIARKMIEDFQSKVMLPSDTLENLASYYGAARDTVRLARDEALAELSRNSGGTLAEL